jgi:hypothetical protein
MKLDDASDPETNLDLPAHRISAFEQKLSTV